MSECKVCKGNAVEALTDYENIGYKGSTLRIKVEYSLCNTCGREFLSKEQIMKNDRILRDAKKVHDGLFSSKEIAHARIKLGLTQEQASVVFGGGRNAFSKYERGEVSQSVAMDKLIKQALKHPIVYRDLLESAGISNSRRSISYENNIVSYSSFKAAYQKRSTPVKCVKMQEVSYG
ncbi:type II toxin-antitoxin system MqsA family antitoxin [Shewanella sp.]|uniref:type II toxin-antitoxin system MqsA family antitoxin n=1 Tax=Shewanella sp. TaxID=50422 RepID=UPI003A98394D